MRELIISGVAYNSNELIGKICKCNNSKKLYKIWFIDDSRIIVERKTNISREGITIAIDVFLKDWNIIIK